MGRCGKGWAGAGCGGAAGRRGGGWGWGGMVVGGGGVWGWGEGGPMGEGGRARVCWGTWVGAGVVVAVVCVVCG